MTNVSVIVPVFNVAPYLVDCIQSLARQSLRDLEFILIDDASTDASLDLLEEHATPRMRVVRNKENLGLAATRNRGLELATGEYVCFVDSDDLISSRHCELMYEAATRDRADVVAGSVTSFRHGSPWAPTSSSIATPAVFRDLRRGHTARAYWYTPRFLFRRSYLDGIGLRFQGNIRLGEDTVFNCEALNRSRHIALVHSPTYHIRQRPLSLTSTRGQPAQVRNLELQYRALKHFYVDRGLWDERCRDLHSYVLDFQLPQAINNARYLASNRADVAGQLRSMTETTWLNESLADRTATHDLGLRRRTTAALLRRRAFGSLAYLYPPHSPTPGESDAPNSA